MIFWRPLRVWRIKKPRPYGRGSGLTDYYVRWRPSVDASGAPVGLRGGGLERKPFWERE